MWRALNEAKKRRIQAEECIVGFAFLVLILLMLFVIVWPFYVIIVWKPPDAAEISLRQQEASDRHVQAVCSACCFAGGAAPAGPRFCPAQPSPLAAASSRNTPPSAALPADYLFYHCPCPAAAAAAPAATTAAPASAVATAPAAPLASDTQNDTFAGTSAVTAAPLEADKQNFTFTGSRNLSLSAGIGGTVDNATTATISPAQSVNGDATSAAALLSIAEASDDWESRMSEEEEEWSNILATLRAMREGWLRSNISATRRRTCNKVLMAEWDLTLARYQEYRLYRAYVDLAAEAEAATRLSLFPWAASTPVSSMVISWIDGTLCDDRVMDEAAQQQSVEASDAPSEEETAADAPLPSPPSPSRRRHPYIYILYVLAAPTIYLWIHVLIYALDVWLQRSH